MAREAREVARGEAEERRAVAAEKRAVAAESRAIQRHRTYHEAQALCVLSESIWLLF